MSGADTTKAARLVYKALHTTLVAENDLEYRELLALYRADAEFVECVRQIAEGLELKVLDFTERGLVVVPTSRDSRFAFRLTDIRTGMPVEQKAALLLAHVAIASVFFPTTEGLEDETYTPRPASVAQFRDALYGLARRLKETDGTGVDMREELAPGWEYITSLPVAVPAAQRASLNSVVGIVRFALGYMTQNGLLLLNRDADDDTATYTQRYRLRVQLREVALRKLFEVAQCSVRERTAEASDNAGASLRE
ncbi:MAG: hypothetical protein EPO20_15520 [Betaproteobacteria bacterium]|nr:MAG: hypothetical protein EPO20_15520 [Betaproteobacteria bacterium]